MQLTTPDETERPDSAPPPGSGTAAPDMPADTAEQIRIATYNVHSCIGTDRMLDPGRTADVINEIDADIVALQEVDAQHRPGGYLDQWAFLAEATGRHCVPGISLQTHRKTFGNALLTRLPLCATRLHDLSVTGREPRGAIDVDIDLAGRPLRIVTTHLGLRSRERAAQARILADLLDADRAAGAVLLGDLNEWRAPRQAIRPLMHRFAKAPLQPTFPSRLPLLALDRILATANLEIADVAVHRSALARRASDHLPVVATLRWAPRDEG